jgi:hypothetical protein
MDVVKLSSEAIKQGLSNSNWSEADLQDLMGHYVCFCVSCVNDPHAMLETAITMRLVRDTRRATKTKITSCDAELVLCSGR